MNDARPTLGGAIGRALVVVLLLAATASNPGCKEGDPLFTGITPANPVFAADVRPPQVTARYVSLRQSSIDGGRIVLDIVASDIDVGVSGLAMKLTYPSAWSRFIDCTDGELFPPGTCFFAEPESGSGEVFIARSVTGIGQTTDVVGDRVIARLEFLVFSRTPDSATDDDARIRIEGQNLGGGDASALLDVDGNPILVDWFSGFLRGVESPGG